MAVLIGSARINEFGELEGGKPGDQNKKEVATEPWYLHGKGWYILRAKSPIVRNKIAQDMRYACANDYVGYSYWDHCYTLYNEVKKYKWDCSKVTIPTETNCAKLVMINILYAGVKVGNFNTGDEVEKVMATGQFDLLKDDKYCKSPDYLLEGDILVTRTKGHTAVVLSNGDKSKAGIPYRTGNCKACHLRAGWTTNDKILATLDSGVRVDLYSWAKNGWGYVSYKDIYGYISQMYLVELDKAVCLNGSTWLRDKAGKNVGEKIIAISAGKQVHLTGETTMVGKTKWYQVIYEGYTGWASGLYIKPLT